jgi:exopolysaccharide biosynthesis polyprenyl glycosylphosphotransferase
MFMPRKPRQFAIGCVDTLLLVLALYAAMTLRRLGPPPVIDFVTHLQSFLPLVALWIVCFYTAGLYSLDTPFTGYKIISAVSVIAVLCTLLGFAAFYFRANLLLTPKTLLVLHAAFSVSFILSWRYAFNHVAVRYFPGPDVAFVHINSTVVELLQNMWCFSYAGYTVRCLLDPDYGEDTCCGIAVYKDSASFEAKIKETGVRLIVFARESDNTGFVQNALFQSLQDRLQFVNLAAFYETCLRRVPISEITDIWFVQNINYRIKAAYSVFKRCVDLILALALLVVTLPFWPLIALAIRLESQGPALFKQRRLGYLGKEFTIWKFRTMRMDERARAIRQTMKGLDPVLDTDQPYWTEPTVAGDPRVTKLGVLLRKTRIDEIPQIINVLRGEMSFIGPRPERPELVVQLERIIPHYRQRLLVKPGLSGWDQVSGEYHSPSAEDTYKKLQYDLYYIKNMSLFLDISIFFKTLGTMARRAGV